MRINKKLIILILLGLVAITCGQDSSTDGVPATEEDQNGDTSIDDTVTPDSTDGDGSTPDTADGGDQEGDMDEDQQDGGTDGQPDADGGAGEDEGSTDGGDAQEVVIPSDAIVIADRVIIYPIENDTDSRGNETDSSANATDTRQNETDATSNETDASQNATETNATETEGEEDVILEASQGEQSIYLFSEYAKTLNGSSGPYLAANNIIPALENMRGLDIAEIADLASVQNKSENLASYFSELSMADDRLYFAVDQQLGQLFQHQGNEQCYSQFFSSIAQIYIGWRSLRSAIFGSNETFQTDIEFSQFCMQYTNFDQNIEDLRSLLMGESECDALQTLYDGSPENNILAGWRDNIVDKSSYLVMYLVYGLSVQEACKSNEENAIVIPEPSGQNATNGDENNDSTDGGNETEDDNDAEGDNSNDTNLESSSEILDAVIDRVLQFDTQARTQVQATVSQNLNHLLKASKGLDLRVMAENVNGFYLFIIYPDYLWQMGAVYSNASADDFYSDCWSCVTVIQGDFQVTVTWVSANSTASLNEGALEQFEGVEGDNQELSTLVWEALGPCVSGVWIFNQNVPYYVSQGFEDRQINYQGPEKAIYAWGVQEQCFGQPLGLY